MLRISIFIFVSLLAIQLAAHRGDKRDAQKREMEKREEARQVDEIMMAFQEIKMQIQQVIKAYRYRPNEGDENFGKIAYSKRMFENISNPE